MITSRACADVECKDLSVPAGHVPREHSRSPAESSWRLRTRYLWRTSFGRKQHSESPFAGYVQKEQQEAADYTQTNECFLTNQQRCCH